ncbi:MAG: hypothetical protein Q7Q71_01710 [Verrucomicrobiota bacterium JB023]|nr:hypothetical protein [Verrucomicrobiota bacterium JB023]
MMRSLIWLILPLAVSCSSIPDENEDIEQGPLPPPDGAIIDQPEETLEGIETLEGTEAAALPTPPANDQGLPSETLQTVGKYKVSDVTENLPDGSSLAAPVLPLTPETTSNEPTSKPIVVEPGSSLD